MTPTFEKSVQKNDTLWCPKNFSEYYSDLVNDHEGFYSNPGAERGLFFELFKKYGYLPITTDSHLGEYLSWAYSVVDHDGILDFYDK